MVDAGEVREHRDKRARGTGGGAPPLRLSRGAGTGTREAFGPATLAALTPPSLPPKGLSPYTYLRIVLLRELRLYPRSLYPLMCSVLRLDHLHLGLLECNPPAFLVLRPELYRHSCTGFDEITGRGDEGAGGSVVGSVGTQAEFASAPFQNS